MEHVDAAVRRLQATESTFNGPALGSWMLEYADIPFYAAFLYVGMVFGGQAWMKARGAFNLKPIFIVWNLILATFSIYGGSICIPYLMEHLVTKGFRYTVCHNSIDWWVNGRVGFWMAVFGLSKIPELIDTVFLVFQKKPVIFLHWYHHTTVMLYCWFAYTTHHTVGVYFACMNYAVHSIMYSYYFLMSVSGPTRKMVKPIAPLITTLQLVQMVGGLGCIIIATVYSNDNEGCEGNTHTILRAALVMYGSYFALFAKFFADAYIFKKKKPAAVAPKRD
jgi:hypothetical protein